MPVVKQDLSPQAVNRLQSLFHRKRRLEEANDPIVAELLACRFAEVDVEHDQEPHLVITDAGKTRVRKWGG